MCVEGEGRRRELLLTDQTERPEENERRTTKVTRPLNREIRFKDDCSLPWRTRRTRRLLRKILSSKWLSKHVLLSCAMIGWFRNKTVFARLYFISNQFDGWTERISFFFFFFLELQLYRYRSQIVVPNSKTFIVFLVCVVSLSLTLS